MSKHNEYTDLYQEEHEKMDQINDLMDEFYTISAEYSLVPEIDPGIGEWSPEKETGLVDAIRIEEEVQGLEGEIREIKKKRGVIKSERRCK